MARTMLLAMAVVVAGGYYALAGGLFCAVSEIPSGDAQEAYVAELRNRGPAGLKEALARYDQFIATAGKMGVDMSQPQPAGDNAEQCQLAKDGRLQLADIVDRVAGQRGATASRLYWYTDLEGAKAAAAESGKPILSLRMLGKLTDEYSCANSRFFRTALYTNKEISDFLRDNFVLHWQSVRPVPRITIDFGDGRKLERTITGNSAHYLLDATGRPLDVLPGLYGPQAFQEWLRRSQSFARWWNAGEYRQSRERLLVDYHTQRRAIVNEMLNADLKEVAPELLNDGAEAPAVGGDDGKAVGVAFAAGSRAATKAFVENPLLLAILPTAERLQGQSEVFWAKIGVRHGELARLDDASIAAIARENHLAQAAGVRAESKRKVENPLLRMVLVFEGSMATDAMRNEYTLHRTVHQWFIEGKVGDDVDALNERVYAELFLTPSSDPWLGLAPRDVYTALDDGGLTAAQ